MKTILSMLAALCLSACCHNPNPPAVPGTLEGLRTEVNIDQRLLEDCEPVSDIGENVRPSDVLEQHGKDVKLVNCLRSKHRALSKTVREAFNLKEIPK